MKKFGGVTHMGEGRGAEVRFGNAGSRRRRASARRLRETKGPGVKPPAAPRRRLPCISLTDYVEF